MVNTTPLKSNTNRINKMFNLINIKKSRTLTNLLKANEEYDKKIKNKLLELKNKGIEINDYFINRFRNIRENDPTKYKDKIEYIIRTAKSKGISINNKFGFHWYSNLQNKMLIIGRQIEDYFNRDNRIRLNNLIDEYMANTVLKQKLGYDKLEFYIGRMTTNRLNKINAQKDVLYRQLFEYIIYLNTVIELFGFTNSNNLSNQEEKDREQNIEIGIKYVVQRKLYGSLDRTLHLITGLLKDQSFDFLPDDFNSEKKILGK